MDIASLDLNERKIFRRLDTPAKVQDFLESIPINFEISGETCYSPRLVLREKKAHCMEGALFACAVFMMHGREPLLMHLRTLDHDEDHAVALFREGKYWGALSKTNHPVLRYRDAIYTTPRELAMSYFHEYFDEHGEKTLRFYSRPFSLRKFGGGWVTSEENLWRIDSAFSDSRHCQVLPKGVSRRNLRLADKIEREASNTVAYLDKVGQRAQS